MARVGALSRKLDGEAPHLISRIYGLEKRVAQLEGALASVTRVTETQPPPQPAAVPPSPAPKIPDPFSAPLTSQPVAFVPPSVAAIPKSPHAPTPALSLPRSSAVNPSQAHSENFEAVVAGRWLNYVGILALLFAVTFFLKYAFDNDWVGPRGRVGIGLLLGSALYPWSQRLLSKGYKYFSEGIAALGAAVLYLSLWAGWHYYQIFSQSTAFTLMIVVTAATFVVAVGRNSERIALLAQIGGLITPLLVSTHENHEVALFTYLLILGAAVLGLAWVRVWQWLLPVQFAATLIFFWGWYADFYGEPALAITIFFATLFFLLFAAIPVVRSWRDGELSESEIGIVVINAISFPIALHQMLWPQYRWTLTIAILALAAAHVGAERLLPAGRTVNTRVARILYAGLALTFATLAIPIRCDGKWITIAWAVEGLILIWSGLNTKFPLMRWAGFLLFAIVTGRLAVISIPTDAFVLNARFATFVFAVACFFAACYFAREQAAETGAEEKTMYLLTAIAANVLLIAALSLEVWDVFGRMPSLGIDTGHAQELALSALWLVYALILLAAGALKKLAVVRWQALVLLGVVIVKVFVFDLSFLEKFYRIVSFSLLGLALLLISFYYQRQLAGRGTENKS
ncbi:MAG TPA: DUF2339 domain-containing protein [Candidatus Acidoferrales bacterium]